MTKIEWTDRTWNPVRGCSRVSPGCDHCYAMRVAHRFSNEVNGKPGPYQGLTVLRPKTAKRPGVDWSGRVRLIEGALEEPLSWRKQQRVFVNSMSDLFHEGLANEEIAAVFGVMAAAPQHTFQVLTKRPARAAAWFKWLREQEHPNGGPGPASVCGVMAANYGAEVDWLGLPETWPLPNVWLGVSAENQQTASDRIPLLLRTPAAMRFVSAEPLLGPLDLTRVAVGDELELNALRGLEQATPQHVAVPPTVLPSLDWVIVGGESGAGARPFHVDWARSIIKQCAAARVACFVKQLGARPLVEPCRQHHWDWGGEIGRKARFEATDPMRESSAPWRVQLFDRKGGEMAEWPEALRVRQFPGDSACPA